MVGRKSRYHVLCNIVQIEGTLPLQNAEDRRKVYAAPIADAALELNMLLDIDLSLYRRLSMFCNSKGKAGRLG